MAGGRPTKYTPELIEKARYYVAHWQEIDETIPSYAGLAVYLKISRDTVHDWANDEGKGEFSDIYKEIGALQEMQLIKKRAK